MAYCGPKALPLSEFLSWDESDQASALAWQSHEAKRCPSCGYHPDDGQPHAHVDVCPGCVQVEHTNATDESKVRGAGVRLVRGTAADCPRCMSVIEMNSRG